MVKGVAILNTLKFDLNKNDGKFKIMHATNGGPWHKRQITGQHRSNFEDYKAAKFPYSRNHDSGVISIYGGPYSHDVAKIFPNFDADPENPESYDFACTDESIIITLEAGTKPFFRLGETIEHQIKKHATLPPKDFKKWAVICEHIIKHYTQGWANGFNYDIEYWEIWNEPDLNYDKENKPTWGGTIEQFCDFYEVAAKHLKECFPNLKIGGPALAGHVHWADQFLCEMQKRNVPMDFFSWHVYCKEPSRMIELANSVKELLVKYGYENAESILNEWNYIRTWIDDFTYSLKAIHGQKGAAFTMSCICQAQKSPNIDMLMYYDTRPSGFCGVFDFYTYEKLKTYYTFLWYSKLYECEYEVRCDENPENIYSLCGVDKDGKAMAVVTHYSENDDTKAKTVKLDFGKKAKYEIYLVDKNHSGELVKVTGNLKLKLDCHSIAFVREI